MASKKNVYTSPAKSRQNLFRQGWTKGLELPLLFHFLDDERIPASACLGFFFLAHFFGEGKQIQVVCWIFDGWDTEMAHNFSSKE